MLKLQLLNVNKMFKVKTILGHDYPNIETRFAI